ncbi:CMRF35-like molecule 8 [Labeo rohita]|uniref:CMRF35-like molecule 8 n=1 Tax=Labeo rohita TaxID=84645 RepID=A0A498L1N5_LABRO|nr:CMRF35-like molecule 8 [Labeo rohita]
MEIHQSAVILLLVFATAFTAYGQPDDIKPRYQKFLNQHFGPSIGYEGKDITFKAMYPPDYETNTKYFGRTHDFFSFEKLVETSHPNRWVKQGRYILFDNTSAHFLTARILRLVAGDSGSYSLGVDIKLLPDFIADEIQLTVITGEAQRPTTPAPKDPLVYVGAGLGALVLIFTVVLFIFIKLKYKLKRRSSCLTSSAQPDSLIYTTPNVTSQSDSLDYSFVKFIKKPNCSVKTSETFEMNPNERVQTLYSSVQNQHQSDITDPNSVIYSSVRKGL